jgi:hypothetical protein
MLDITEESEHWARRGEGRDSTGVDDETIPMESTSV